jgi:probable phosphoglycerate mutase
MRLLLLRHGQTTSNVGGILDTAAPGAALTELGERQAAAVPEALREEPIQAVFASVLLRAQQTAAPTARARGLDVDVRNGLQEIEAGDLEGLSDRDSQIRYMSTAIAWGDGDMERRIPGGPSGTEFFARYDAAIERIAQEHDGTVLVVSHGAAIRVWAAGRTDNVDPEFSRSHDLENTGLVIVSGEPGAWTTESWTGTPVGGGVLADATATDPTGESLDDVASGRTEGRP